MDKQKFRKLLCVLSKSILFVLYCTVLAVVIYVSFCGLALFLPEWVVFVVLGLILFAWAVLSIWRGENEKERECGEAATECGQKDKDENVQHVYDNALTHLSHSVSFLLCSKDINGEYWLDTVNDGEEEEEALRNLR